ncbi:4-deoxy-L-threo-5-hexosulose-uronate ketol-isomerase [Kluyvera ascorbata]|uniref:4-deoxy-L-threo-5-hexosulose-uronate ketol-isomerase n=1 Tax=Kluyvera ascorbata TaxID=51288 RepID=A0A3N2SAF3_9ENTR|nr:4-deoxy-L-threo-5-hexosulose-uronate ketol-isomerase [Kluyvera ascorbata]
MIGFAFLRILPRKNETMFYLQLKTHFIRDKIQALNKSERSFVSINRT